MVKLTLSVPAKVPKIARKKARKSGRSISAMFSEWVMAENPEDTHKNQLAPLTRSLSGIINLPQNFNEKEEMAEILAAKYKIKS